MIKKVRKRYNTLKWVLGIMLFIGAVLFAISWHIRIKLAPLVKTQIKEMVLNATDSLYRIEFSDLNTNFITGRASLTDVKIIPDTVVYKKLVALKKAPNNMYAIQLKKLAMKNFYPRRILQHKKLKIDELLFENPDVVMVNRQFDFNDDRQSYRDRSPYDYIAKYVSELQVGIIDFKNIRFKYINNNLRVPVVDSIKNLNITLNNWLIDKNSAKDKSRLYLLKDIVINLNDYRFATPDSLYHIHLNQLDFSAASGKLNIKRFKVIPRYDEMKFSEAADFAKDRFSIQFSDISMDRINLPLYISKQELYAGSMTIANGFVDVFTNNPHSRKGAAKIGRYPHQLLQKIQAQLTVEQVNLKDVDISYAAFNHVSKHKGKITFEKTSGTISNVTNAARMKSKNPYLAARLSTYMMGQGQLDVNFNCNLAAKQGDFSYSGVLGPMDGRVLNQITKPLAMVVVKSGQVKKLEFNVEANDQRAKGNMAFAFNDLSFGLLKKHKLQDRLVKQGLISILANAMVINSDNPNTAGVFINAPINYEREQTASFFSFIWKTLFQGIKHSVGMSEEKTQRIKAQITKFERIKADREKRKAGRKQRRALRSR